MYPPTHSFKNLERAEIERLEYSKAKAEAEDELRAAQKELRLYEESLKRDDIQDTLESNRRAQKLQRLDEKERVLESERQSMLTAQNKLNKEEREVQTRLERIEEHKAAITRKRSMDIAEKEQRIAELKLKKIEDEKADEVKLTKKQKRKRQRERKAEERKAQIEALRKQKAQQKKEEKDRRAAAALAAKVSDGTRFDPTQFHPHSRVSVSAQ